MTGLEWKLPRRFQAIRTRTDSNPDDFFQALKQCLGEKEKQLVFGDGGMSKPWFTVGKYLGGGNSNIFFVHSYLGK